MTSRYILTLLLVLLLCSCNRRPAPLHPALQRAEQLMQDHPDSALAVLNHYNSRSFSDSADMAAYALLRTKAEDKNYIDRTNDSLIRIAVRYYDRRGCDFQKAEAHYYWGRIFQNKRDDVHTAEQFIKASSYKEAAHDAQLSSKIKSNLAYLLWSDGLLDASDSIYRQLLPILIGQQDKERVSICYLKLGEIAMQSDKPDLKVSECYLRKSLYYAMKINNTDLNQNIFYSLSILYNNMKKANQALYYGKKALTLSENSTQKATSSSAIGISYFLLNKNDSSIHYLRQSITTIGSDINEQACRILATIYKGQGDLNNYSYYNEKLIQYKDSLAKEKRPADVATSIYKLISARHDNQQLISKMKIAFVLILVCYILLFILYLYCRNKREQNKISNQRHIQSVVNNRQIDVFIENKVKERLANERRLNLKEQISSSAIFKELTLVCSYNEKVVDKDKKQQLSESSWADLEKEVLKYLPDFASLLESHYDLSKKDIRFCCLVRLEFNYSEIAGIFGCSPQAVSKRKKRLFNQFDVESTTAFERKLKNI